MCLSGPRIVCAELDSFSAKMGIYFAMTTTIMYEAFLRYPMCSKESKMVWIPDNIYTMKIMSIAVIYELQGTYDEF